VALRDVLRRAPEPPSPAAPQAEAVARPEWPSPPAAEAAPATAADWAAEPGFAPVAVEERADGSAGDWSAATDPIDVTDHTVELPALPAPPGPGRRRAWRAALTLALVLGCAGAALAASGVLRSKDEMPAPVRIGAASSIAVKPAHHAKAKPKAKPAKRAHHPARRHRHARHRAAAAPAHVAAPVPAASAAPAPSAPVVHHVVSSPKPTQVSTPRPTPKPVVKQPTTTSSQPAPSAPSGEPGRQPPPAP
jgi:hypothetical protein